MIREKANPGIYDHYPMEVGQISALRLINRQVKTFGSTLFITITDRVTGM